MGLSGIDFWLRDRGLRWPLIIWLEVLVGFMSLYPSSNSKRAAFV